MKIKGATKCGGQTLFGTWKTHLTGEFVIVAKFGDCALCHLASSLSNVVKQVAGMAGRQADEKSSLGDFSKNIWLW